MALNEREHGDADAAPDFHPLLSGRSSRRRALVSVAVAVLLGSGVWLLIGQATSFATLSHSLSSLKAWWLAGAVGAAAVGYVGYALLYQGFVRLRGGPRPTLGLVMRLAVAIFAASVIATSAGRLGSEYWSLRRMHEPPAKAWSRTLAINAAAWAVLAALSWCAATALLAGGNRQVPFALELVWLLALPAGVLPATVLSSPRMARLTTDRGGRVRRALASVLASLVLIRQAIGLRDVAILAGGLLYWAGDLLVMWSALAAFGVRLGIAALVIGYATGYASTMLPLPAGGAGGVDAATTYALHAVGVPLGRALLATLVFRICTYWLPLFVALASVRSLRRLPGDLAATPGAITAVRVPGAASAR